MVWEDPYKDKTATLTFVHVLSKKVALSFRNYFASSGLENTTKTSFNLLFQPDCFAVLLSTLALLSGGEDMCTGRGAPVQKVFLNHQCAMTLNCKLCLRVATSESPRCLKQQQTCIPHQQHLPLVGGACVAALDIIGQFHDLLLMRWRTNRKMEGY